VGGAPGSGVEARRARHRRVGAAATLVVAFAAGALWRLGTRESEEPRGALPIRSGSVAVAGLQTAVQVDRDPLGVPHIDARSEGDAFFALGYVQAQDRLEQLFALRRRARGTASEVEGVDALDGDRVARLIGFADLAERQLEHLDASTRGVLEAYAAGVNARIARLEAGREPAAGREPWRSQDSLAVFKLFAWSLSESVQASLVLNELVEALGAQQAGRFFPPRGRAPTKSGRATAGVPGWLAAGATALRRAPGRAGGGVGSSTCSDGRTAGLR
jgi:penicillin amidase